MKKSVKEDNTKKEKKVQSKNKNEDETFEFHINFKEIEYPLSHYISK